MNNEKQKFSKNETKPNAQTQQEKSERKGSTKKDVATYRYEKSNGQDHYGHYMNQGKPLGSLGSSWPGLGKPNQPEITKPTSSKPEASKPNKKMHRVVFMNHLDEVIEEKYVLDGASVLAPEVEALEGRHFVGWDYLLTNIKTDLVVRPVYRVERYPVEVVLEDGSYVGRDFFYHGTEIEYIKDYLNLSYGPILGLEEQYYITDIAGDFEVLTESSKVTVKLGIKELNLEYYVDDQLEYSQKLAFGEQIKHPQPQKDKEGYRFISWGEEAPKRAHPHYHGQTIRLDAVYEIETFDAKYYINDQEVHAEKVAYNQKPQGMNQKQLEAYIPEGYEFVKWDKKIQAIQEDVEYHAILAKKEYTVKIVDSQGNVLSKEKVKHGDTIKVPENTEVKEGYHFVKWSHDGKNIRSDLNIRPIFAINVYTVKFLDEAGNLIESVKVEHGSDAKAPQVPEKPGWDFLKWSDNIQNVEKDMEVKVIYGRQVKNVTFVDHDGQTLSTVRVEYGEALDKTDIPSGPQRVGYRFVYWDADLDKITDHIIVKPVYEVKTFDVVFKTEDGDIIEKIEVQEGQYPKAPQAPNRAGHHFVSWEPKLTPVQSDQEYVAKYAINQYEIIVLGMDGKELAKKVVEHGQDLEEIKAPKQEGYHFVRWDGNFQNITEDRTIRAIYAINEYDVDFVMGDEVVRKVVKHGHAVEYPKPIEMEGRRFIRWDKKVDKVTSDLTITAVYESAKYEVIFQDENGRILDKVLVEHGKEAKTDKIPQKEGYEFVAWDIDLSSVTEDGLIAKPQYEVKMFDLTISKRFLGYASVTLDQKELAKKMEDSSILEDLVIQVPYGSNVTFERTQRGFTGNIIIESEHLDEGREVHKVREYEYFNDPVYKNEYFFNHVTEDIDTHVSYLATSFRYNLVDEDGHILRTERGYIGSAVNLDDYSIKKDLEREGYDVVGTSENGLYLTGPEDVVVKYAPITIEVRYYDKEGNVFAKGERLYTEELDFDAQDPVQYEEYDFVAWEVEEDIEQRITHVKPKYEIKKFDLKFFYKDPYSGEKKYFNPSGVPNVKIPYGTDMRSYEDAIIQSAKYIGFDASVNQDQLKSIESNAEIEIDYVLKDSAVAVDVNVEGKMQTYYVEVVNNSPEDVLRYTNEHRRANGVAEMRLRDEYLDAAIQRATEAAVKFSHSRPFKDEKGNYADASTVFEDIYGIDLSHKVNENLGHTNRGSSKSAVESWKASEGHNRTMLDGDYKSMISVGVIVDYRAPHVRFGPDYWVQLFFRD